MEKNLLKKFKTYLIKSKLSKNTIRSYYKDINLLYNLVYRPNWTNEDMLKSMYEITFTRYNKNSLFKKITSINKFRAFLARERLIDTEIVKPKKYFSKQLTSSNGLQEQKYFELIALLRNKTRDSLIVEILYETGIRLDELLNLRVENIFFKKNGSYILLNRKLEISKQLSSRLKEFCKQKNKSDLVFQGPKGSLNPKTVRKIIQVAGEHIGIFDLSPSSFRASFIKKLISLKMDDKEIAYLAGIKTLNNLNRYKVL